MYKKYGLFITAILLCIYPLSAAWGEVNNRIVICDFSLVAPTTDEDYYSFIIPDGLNRQLTQKGTYPSIRVNRQLHPGILADSPQVGQDKETLRGVALETGAEWLITGTVVLTAPPAPPAPKKGKKKRKLENAQTVVTGTMTLILLIYDSTLDRTEVVATIPFRQEALVQKAIDMVSAEALRQIGIMEQEKFLARQKAEEEPGESPWKAFAGAMSPFSAGIDCGRFFFTGSWRDLYKDTTYVSPWLDLSLNSIFPGLGFTCSMSHVASPMLQPPTSEAGILQLWTASAGPSYRWQPLGWLSLDACVTAGMAWTRIHTYPSSSSTMPFVDSSNSESLDPFMDLGCAVRFSLKPVHFRTGLAYRRIFYTGEDLNGLSLFAGVSLGL